MKKFISLMNNQSIYHLWKNGYQSYLIKTIKEILGEEDKYDLLDTINKDTNNLRSYIFLESKSRIVYLSFNNYNNDLKVNYDMDIINYLNFTTKKKTCLIIFHNQTGNNLVNDNVYHIFINKSNSHEIKLLMSKTIKEQRKYDNYGIIDYLYNLDDTFYKSYLKEQKKEENIGNFTDV